MPRKLKRLLNSKGQYIKKFDEEEIRAIFKQFGTKVKLTPLKKRLIIEDYFNRVIKVTKYDDVIGRDVANLVDKKQAANKKLRFHIKLADGRTISTSGEAARQIVTRQVRLQWNKVDEAIKNKRPYKIPLVGVSEAYRTMSKISESFDIDFTGSNETDEDEKDENEFNDF